MNIIQKFDRYFTNLHKDRENENRLLMGQIMLEEKRRLWASDIKFAPLHGMNLVLRFFPSRTRMD
jgi:hypothetical protein